MGFCAGQKCNDVSFCISVHTTTLYLGVWIVNEMLSFLSDLHLFLSWMFELFHGGGL